MNTLVPYRIFEVWGSTSDAPEVPDGKLIAVNYSYWSWEYDSDYVDAYLYLVGTEKLYLRVERLHVKSGLGKGERKDTLYSDFVGTIFNHGNISSVIKPFGHDKSSASATFQKKWVDAANSGREKNMRSLKDILFDYTEKGRRLKVQNRFDL